MLPSFSLHLKNFLRNQILKLLLQYHLGLHWEYMKITDVEQCKELKMGSYLAVAATSANPPHFIHLCYKPPRGPVNAKLALVGKGLTFDSGGYNIKTGPGYLIELMKFDMSGSAAVLGAAKALGQIKPLGVEVHFIIAACENMISGIGMRPGDIVTASNGKTIEHYDGDVNELLLDFTVTEESFGK